MTGTDNKGPSRASIWTWRGTAFALLGALATGVVAYACLATLKSSQRDQFREGLAATLAPRSSCQHPQCKRPTASRRGFEVSRQSDDEIPEWQGQHRYCADHNPYVCRRCKREFHKLPTSTWQCTTCSGYLVRR